MSRASRWSVPLFFVLVVVGVWTYMAQTSGADLDPLAVVVHNSALADPGVRRWSAEDPESLALRRTPASDSAVDERFTTAGEYGNATLLLTVTDELGRPIPGALVRCGAPSDGHYGMIADRVWSDASLPVYGQAYTAEDGVARVVGLPSRQVVLLAAEAAHRVRIQELLVTGGDGSVAAVGPWSLEPAAPVRIRFTTEDGLPATDVAAVLEFHAAAGDRRDISFEFRSDHDGSASVEHVPDGMMSLRVLEPLRFATYHVSPVLQPGEREALVVLERGRTISGRVLDADGQPVSGARIGLSTFAQEHDEAGEVHSPWFSGHVPLDAFRTKVVSAVDGSFRLDGLCQEARLFALTAFLEPDQYYAGPWLTDPNQVELRLPRRHLLRFRVEGPFALDQARVSLWDAEGGYDSGWDLMIDAAHGHCGADGVFERYLPAGSWKIEIRYPGGREVIEERLSLTTDRDLGVVELGAGARLRIRLPGSTAAAPADFLVELPRRNRNAKNPWRRSEVRDLRFAGDGVWEFLSIPPGRYRVFLRVPGWEAIASELTIEPGEVVELTASPPRTGSVLVNVLDEAGGPVRARMIHCKALLADPPTPREALLQSAPGDYPYFESPVGADGVAVFSDLPAGNYEVLLGDAEEVGEGWSTDPGVAVGRVEVHAGSMVRFELNLSVNAGDVEFLVSSRGLPVSGARIAYWRLAKPGSFGWSALSEPRSGGVTTTEGRFTASGLTLGSYLVGVRTAEHAAWTIRETEVLPGKQVVVIERSHGELSGQVLDSRGGPAMAHVTLCSQRVLDLMEVRSRGFSVADLEIWQYAGDVGSTRTDANGSFHFRDLDRGWYRVLAESGESQRAWSALIEVGEDDSVSVGDLLLLEIADVEWTLRGCSAWSDHWLSLAFRPAEGGEVWQHEVIYTFSDEDEDVVNLDLPLGSWAVEFLDREGKTLAPWTVIEISRGVSPLPAVLPLPSSVGADRDNP